MKQCQIYLFLCLAIVSCDAQCSHRTQNNNDCTSNPKKEYVFHDMRVNWFRAFQVCEENGMKLATINSRAENEQVRDLVRHIWTGIYAWTGGAMTDINMNFSWLKAPTQMPYQNFPPGRPAAYPKALCLCVGYDGTWYNGYCEAEYYFVCEREVTSRSNEP